MEKFLDYLWQLRSRGHSHLFSGSVCGGVKGKVSMWLLGCDCLCPVTPQGGVLWHATGQFHCIYSSLQSRA